MDRQSNLLSVLAIAGLAALSGLASPAPATAETVLVMAEKSGCVWCAAWNRDVAPEYPVTAEGRAAPLRRVDIHALPDDLAFAMALRYTPTFVLMRDGRELDRLEGYPGEDFFWGLLQQMLNEAGIALGAEG